MKAFRYLALAFAVMHPAQAMATHICWIDHLARASGGLNLYFAVKPKLSATVMPWNHAREVQYMIAGGQVDSGRGKTGSLFLRDGDKVSLSQIEEARCNLTVTADGINAVSALDLPGSSVVQGSGEFIPAE